MKNGPNAPGYQSFDFLTRFFCYFIIKIGKLPDIPSSTSSFRFAHKIKFNLLTQYTKLCSLFNKIYYESAQGFLRFSRFYLKSPSFTKILDFFLMKIFLFDTLAVHCYILCPCMEKKKKTFDVVRKN